MGIARYELSKQIPEPLQDILPSTTLLEGQLSNQLLKVECCREQA